MHHLDHSSLKVSAGSSFTGGSSHTIQFAYNLCDAQKLKESTTLKREKEKDTTPKIQIQQQTNNGLESLIK